MANGEPIGRIDTAEGNVFILHADGNREEISPGDAVFAGDRLETGEDGRMSMTLVDQSRFSLGENGAMTMDEMVYDGNGADGAATVSVINGVFVFVSGQIAKMSVDAMIIKTPTMTMGIRGTKIVGRASETGDTVTLLREDSGHVGEIVAFNGDSAQVLNQENQTVRVGAYGGAISEPLIVPGAVISDMYGAQLLMDAWPVHPQHLDFQGPPASDNPESATVDPLAHKAVSAASSGSGDQVLLAQSDFGFERFKLLHDRLFERQFIDSHIYPDHDVQPRRVDQLSQSNTLLEDAFNGARFALAATSTDGSATGTDTTTEQTSTSDQPSEEPIALAVVGDGIAPADPSDPLPKDSAQPPVDPVDVPVPVDEPAVHHHEPTLADRFGIAPADRPVSRFTDEFLDHVAAPARAKVGKGRPDASGQDDHAEHGHPDKALNAQRQNRPEDRSGHHGDHDAGHGHGYSVTEHGHGHPPTPDFH